MSVKKRRNQRRKDPNAVQYRELTHMTRAASINDETRSVDATISTENPVEMMDWERWEIVPEVLLSDGMQVDPSRQVPMLDSHHPRTTRNQLGSVRNVEVDGNTVKGTLAFASRAEDEWDLVREGHATDVSVGYRILRVQYVEPGKTKTIRGREFTGPVNVVTKWRLLEVSLTPIGADEMAKLRGFDPSTLPVDTKGFVMNEQLRALLIEAGMPEDLDDAAAQDWLVENRSALAPKEEPKQQEVPKQRFAGTDGESLSGHLAPQVVQRMIADGITGALAEQEKQRAAFRQDVDSMLELAGVEVTDKARFYALESKDAVRAAIIEERKKHEVETHTAPRIEFGAAGRDKHYSAVRTAILERCFNENSSQDERVTNERSQAVRERLFPQEERSKDASQFRNYSLYAIAEECLRMDGVDVRGRSREEIAMAALGFGDQIGIRTEPGYHTTGSFPKLTQDAINKSMMLGYGEYPATWRGPMRQGTSVSDFKKIHRMQLGAVPNLPIWNDSKDPEQASMADAEETYAVECRSLALSFNYKLLINDDMSVISRSPFKLGDAASRTVNTVAWSQITSNPTMRDGQSLFSTVTGNRKRLNLTTGAGAPSATTIQTLTNLMMQMRGENTPEGNEGQDILGLMPRYIVGPSALRTTILQVVRSIADPNGTHAGVVNINNDLVPVIEPLLDANSTTGWYLFAEPTRVETVEVTFLQGQETPRTRMITDPKKLSQEYIILQTFAAKALDHRGVQKHAGA